MTKVGKALIDDMEVLNDEQISKLIGVAQWQFTRFKHKIPGFPKQIFVLNRAIGFKKSEVLKFIKKNDTVKLIKKLSAEHNKIAIARKKELDRKHDESWYPNMWEGLPGSLQIDFLSGKLTRQLEQK
jgi:predicted DNA-binding transcriptional regulator AlpA